MSILDSILDGAVIVSQEHDVNKIAYEVALEDEAELRKFYSAEQIAEMKNNPEKIKEAIQAAIKRANLNVNNGKVSAAFAGKTAWHTLGTVVDKNMTAEEALKFGGQDFEVVKRKVYYSPTDDPYPDFNLFGYHESEDDYVFVRTDTWQRLGRVGSRSVPIQNKDRFKVCDPILGNHQGNYVSVGALGEGEKVWICAEFPQERYEVTKGDVLEAYMAFMGRHDGKGCDRLFPTSLRIECENTLNIAVGQAQQKGIRIRHTGDIKQKLKEAEKAMFVSLSAFSQFKEKAAALVATKVPDVVAYANDVLDTVLDISLQDCVKGADVLVATLAVTEAERELERKKFANKIKRRGEVLFDILERHESETCGLNGMRGTGWGVFNAFTEHADHGIKYRGDHAAENRFESVLYGKANTMKQVALEEALRYTY